MSLPIFKKIELTGTVINHSIEPNIKYFCKLKPESIGDGSGHQFPRGWYTGEFNVCQGFCTFMCNEYIDVELTEIEEVYKILEEES